MTKKLHIVSPVVATFNALVEKDTLEATEARPTSFTSTRPHRPPAPAFSVRQPVHIKRVNSFVQRRRNK